MIYIIEHASYGDIFRTYDGMGQETVEALVAESGNPFDVVDEATYNAKIAAVEEARNKAHPVL
jgi:hypothetical protein